MFFLTKNLKKIASKESISEKSSMCDSEYSNLTIRTTEFILVKILKMVNLGEMHYGLKLFDGTDIIHCAIEKERCPNTQGNEFKQGIIIHVNEYSYVKLQNLATLNKSHAAVDGDKKILNILVYNLVGMCFKEHTEFIADDVESAHKIIEKSVINTNLICDKRDGSITNINLLSSTLNKKNWKIKAILKKIGRLREFKKKTGESGHNVRYLFQDQSGYTELSVFNELTCKVENLEIDKTYEISQGLIKYAKQSCLEWSTQLGLVPFEIVMTKETLIIQSIPEKSENIDSIPQKFEEASKQNSREQIEKFTDDNHLLIKEIYKKKNIIPLNHLLFRNVNDSINVIGIVTEFDLKIKKIVKNFRPLSVRNFSIIDKSDIIVKIALWGNEAESCHFECGEILMLTGCVITNFGGLSLSVVRATTITNLSKEVELPIVKDLKDWMLKKNLDKNGLKRKFFDVDKNSNTGSKLQKKN